MEASYLKEYYTNIFDKTDESLTEKEHDRICSTINLIPEDVKTILDIGCGDGRIANLLASDYWVVGADFIFHPLKKLKAAKTCTEIKKLAFKENSFDLVMLTEVLEHLTDDFFYETVRNVQNVSKKYILVTVPYRQNLRSGFIKCEKCANIFHVWQHIRDFKGTKDLENLFSGYKPIKYAFFGENREYKSNLILIIKQKLGNRWFKAEEHTVCLRCGNTEFPYTQRNIVTMICGAFEKLLKKIPLKQKSWIGVLYLKCSG
ncbi:MAG: class I SAM-dependent methyltransferase [Candidatus Schekmanbacteria bacterium]|nr:class I SAM-dependent methyltransferase [Candidatus Schekmanbacteria bacterium]